MGEGIPPGINGFKALGNGADTFLRPSIDRARDYNRERADIAKRKIEALASESQSAKNKMGWKLALMHKGLSLPDNGGRYVVGDDDFNPMRKAETPVSDSQSAKTEMGQEMVLLHQESSSRHIDVDGDYNPRDEELDNVAGELDACDNPYRDVGYGPIRGKRGRPARSKSVKSKIEQKPALFVSSFGRSNYTNGDKDDCFETPMKKISRPERSKSARRKREQELILVDSSDNSSEGMIDKDDDFQPEVSADGAGRKKYAGNYRINGVALKRAMEVEKKLPAEGPIFFKCMMHSQVVQGFSLGIPANFCRDHLPNHDDKIVLEDEEGKTYETKYIAYNMRLSGGWKGFVKQQHLKVDDAVVFQLVKPTTFKVYILRENEFTATNGALCLLDLAQGPVEHPEAHA